MYGILLKVGIADEYGRVLRVGQREVGVLCVGPLSPLVGCKFCLPARSTVCGVYGLIVPGAHEGASVGVVGVFDG